jgi:hypothetical protein
MVVAQAALVEAVVAGQLDKESLERVLKSQTATATIRGAVREEYVESLEMSRL